MDTKKKLNSCDEILAKVRDDSLRDLYYELLTIRKISNDTIAVKGLESLIKRIEQAACNDIEKQKKLLKSLIFTEKETENKEELPFC